MTKMTGNNTVSSEQVKNLKRRLEVWREAALPLHDILIWEKPWHPGFIVGMSTVFYLTYWYLDPSMLTTLGFVGLMLTVFDYLNRVLGSYVTRATNDEKWTGKDEKKLEEVCHRIIAMYNFMSSLLSTYFEMRNSRTKTYYAVTVTTLAVLTWLGSIINNLFFTYLCVTIVLLLPGASHHGILKRWLSSLILAISQALKGGTKTIENTTDKKAQ